jgi:hypothetical protein
LFGTEEEEKWIESLQKTTTMTRDAFSCRDELLDLPGAARLKIQL